MLLGFEGEAKQRPMDTIAHYNDIVESGVDTDYGKEPHPPLEDYRAALLRLLVRGALLTTLDGLRINEDMQALTADGSVMRDSMPPATSGCFYPTTTPSTSWLRLRRTCTEGRHVARLLAGDLA